MLESAADACKAIISGVWQLTDITLPGVSFTFRQMWIGLFLISVSLTILRMCFSIGGGDSATSSRSGSSRHAKISSRRANDEK